MLCDIYNILLGLSFLSCSNNAVNTRLECCLAASIQSLKIFKLLLLTNSELSVTEILTVRVTVEGRLEANRCIYIW